MRPIFISAGCTRKPHVSSRLADRMVYGSKSNVVVADDKKVLDVIHLDGNIDVVECGHGMILAGDCEGNGYVIRESEVMKCDFGASIEVVGFLDSEHAVFCTMESSFIYKIEERSIKFQVKNEGIPTCLTVVGKKMFLGTRKGSVFMLAVEEDFKTVCEMKEHNDSIQDIKSMELDGDVYIATSSQDETIKIWKLVEDSSPLSHVQTLNGHSDWIYGLFWTSEGDLLSASGDCSIIYWKKKEMWENIMRLGGEKAFFNVLMVGDSIIGQSYSGGFYKFQSELKHYISGHTDEISSIDWRGDFLLTASLDMTSRIFYRGAEVGRPQIHGYPLTSARFLNENNLNLISSGQETILRAYEPTQAFYMSCVCVDAETYDAAGSLERLSISNSGRSLYDFFDNIEDLKPIAVPAELSLTNELVDDFEFESLNEQLLSTSTFNEIKKMYGHYFEISDIAVSKKFIVSCNKSLLKKFSGIFVWNRCFELVQYIEEHEYGIQRLRFSPDGRYLAAVSKDKTASVYNVGERIEVMQRLKDHKRIVWDCSFSHDSRYLATCSRDKNVFVYEQPGFKKRFSAKLDWEVTSLCFSPTKPILLVGLESGEIVVMEISEDGLAIKNRSKEHSKQVNVIQFSEDGSRCATGGADGMVKVFLFD